MCTKSYLQKRYKDYNRTGVPVESLAVETLADKEEYVELKNTVKQITASRSCPSFIPLPVFVFVIDDFLK